jgi:hypothetical protein
MYWFYLDGLRTSIRTRISFGQAEIGNPLLGLMAREMSLSKNDFLLFVKCDLTGDDYRQQMIAGGRIRNP